MKILIATGIFPPDIGGPATMLAALAEALEKNGFVVKIITYSEKGGREKNIIRVQKAGFLSRFNYFLKMIFLSFWADVIYVTDTYSVGYFAYLIKKLTGKKYILRFAGDSAWEMATARGWTKDYITDFEGKKYSEKIEKMKNRRRKVLVNSGKVIAVSNFLNELVKKIGAPKEKVITIYNSIEFQKQKNKKETKALNLRNQLGDEAKIIICSSRLVSWKGVDTVIKIMPTLIKKINNLHLVILGDGPQMNDLKNLADFNKIQDRVHFMGKIQQEEIESYLKEANLFVLNTYYEGLSHMILEAMAAGVPVLTTKVGGNSEIITDNENGILVEYNNEEQLKRGIEIMLNDKNLAAQFVKNGKEMLKKFNWDNTVNETIRAIKKLHDE